MEQQMTNEEIIKMYDYSPVTLKELSVITGKSVEELKALLMSDYYSYYKPV